MFTAFLSTYIYFAGEKCFSVVESNATTLNVTTPVEAIDCMKSEESTIVYFLTILFWAIIVAREFLQFLFSMKSYFCYKENYLEFTLLCAVGYLFAVEPNRELALVSIILAYVELTLFIARYPYVSTYLSIFIQVSKNSLGLLCIFCPIIFAFSLGFHAVLLETDNLGVALFKSLVMLTGEIETENFKLDSVGRIICLIFIIFVVIVFSNVLNALAISDTQLIINKAELLSCIKKVQTYSKFEKTWIKYFCYCEKHIPANNVIELIVQKVCKLTFSKEGNSWFRINACPLHYCYDTGSHYKLLSGNTSVSKMSRLVQKYLFGFDNGSISKLLVEVAQKKTNMSNNSFDEFNASTKSLNACTINQINELKSDFEYKMTALEVKLDKITNILLSMPQNVTHIK